MTTRQCTDCGKDYNPDTVVKVSPIPDHTCAICMNTLTEQEMNAFLEKIGAPALNSDLSQFKE